MRSEKRLDSRGRQDYPRRVRLLGSGAIPREIVAAADLLLEEFGIAGEFISVTSFSELARDASATERHNLFRSDAGLRTTYLSVCLPGTTPTIAATDYVRAYP